MIGKCVRTCIRRWGTHLEQRKSKSIETQRLMWKRKKIKWISQWTEAESLRNGQTMGCHLTNRNRMKITRFKAWTWNLWGKCSRVFVRTLRHNRWQFECIDQTVFSTNKRRWIRPWKRRQRHWCRSPFSDPAPELRILRSFVRRSWPPERDWALGWWPPCELPSPSFRRQSTCRFLSNRLSARKFDEIFKSSKIILKVF